MTANSAALATGGYNIKAVEGLESPVRRVPYFQTPNKHGAFVSNGLYGERVVVVRVEVIGSSESDYKDKVSALAEELDITSSYEKTASFTDTDGTSYYVTGVPRMLQNGEQDARRVFGDMVFELLCDDHRIYASTATTTTMYLEDTSGGVTIPTAIPISFGSGEGGEYTITNNGTVKTYPTIRLHGSLTNPTIKNVTTDDTFQYDATIANGDYIDVDMQNMTVIDQNGNDKLSSVDADLRDFWGLDAGANTIQFTHESTYNGNARAVVTHYDAYTCL